MRNNTFNILFLGDIIGSVGRNLLERELNIIKEEYNIDFVGANVENLANGFGLNENLYQEMEGMGINIMTSGNHIWDRKEIIEFIPQFQLLLRPANYPLGTPGVGVKTFYFNKLKISFVNLLGRVFMPIVDCPFRKFNEIFSDISDNIIIVDFHAEATSEKNAFCHYVDGRASAVLGTHTHVQTNDDRRFPLGTYYISDVGMCGSLDSVIGMEKEGSIKKFLTSMPTKFEVEKSGRRLINGVVLKIDKENKSIAEFIKIRKIY
ncbi:MAG: TIGR00282 family metallophosphoesterase [Deferribacterota bacterium]|nr:TIGR00282 family metallophosphoesterase [Deferribacterota bacterium]